jgi:hypothetical protein
LRTGTKAVLTAIIYASEIPIGFLAGFYAGVDNILMAVILTIATIGLEIWAVMMWMEAQTEKINNFPDYYEEV